MGIEAAIIGSAVLGAGASVVGANKASKAASQATAAQTDAANKQVALSKEIYYDQRGLQQPYYQAGLQGLYGPSGVMALMGMNQPAAQQTAQPQPVGSSQIVNVGGGAYMPGGQTQPLVQAGTSTPAGQNAFAQYASGTYGATPITAPSLGYQSLQDVSPGSMLLFRNAMRSGADAGLASESYIPPEYLPSIYPQASASPQPVGAPQLVNTGGGAMQQGGEAQPMVQAGSATTAQPSEGPMTAALRQTPGYQFLQDENKRALENSFASRGNLLSGAAMKALQERSMGIADQTYQQTLNNAFNLSNIGMGAAAQIQNAGSNYGASAGNAFVNMGNAAAQGAYNKASAWNAGAQGAYGAAMGGLGMYGANAGWFN